MTKENGSVHCAPPASTDLLRWEKCGAISLHIPPVGRGNGFDNTYFDNLAGAGGTTSRSTTRTTCCSPTRSRSILPASPADDLIAFFVGDASGEGDKVDGAWNDCGPIFRPIQNPPGRIRGGAGPVPLPLGDNRYLAIIHTGHRATDGSRLYTLDALVLNFDKFDPKHPQRIVEPRLDRLMTPQTKWEIERPYPDSVGNVLFSCGEFERNGEIFVIYGGGDTYVMAAHLNKAEILAAMVSM